MDAHAKFWIEKDGKLVMSDFRVRLLRHIDETGSLSEAATRMGLSYRRAWGKVREIEANLGAKLIETSIGGHGGGGSRLTPEGRRMVERYERFRARAVRDLGAEFVRSFGGTDR